MRVLFVSPYYYPELKFGGPPRKMHAISRGLATEGHAVSVVTHRSDDRGAAVRSDVEGIAVQYLPWSGTAERQLPAGLSLLSAEIRSADLVHCYGLYNFICPIAVRHAGIHRKPVVLEPLGMFPPRARNQWAKLAYNLIVTRWMIRRSRAVVAASQSEAAQLQTIAPADKIVHRRNGIDVQDFARRGDDGALRRRWDIAPNERLVLYVGRISPIKNLKQLLLAFERAAVPGARLVLVGPLSEPAYEAKLRRLIEERALGARVRLVGPLYEEEQRAALATADLFVLPSLNESFGNAAAEAVAADVPVLLTETCGIAALIHERAGLAVPLGVESLAEGLRQMLDPARVEQLTSRREEVKRGLSWEEPIAQTVELYERVFAEFRGSKA
jgi:glycosyltransferase involved in cell wall biosynthesis